MVFTVGNSVRFSAWESEFLLFTVSRRALSGLSGVVKKSWVRFATLFTGRPESTAAGQVT